MLVKKFFLIIILFKNVCFIGGNGYLSTGELGYDGPLYDILLPMTDDVLSPSPMHIKYVTYVYAGFCIGRTNFPDPIESVISKFACIYVPSFMHVFG